MTHKKTIYKFAIIILTIITISSVTISAVIIACYKTTQSNTYQIEKTFHIKLPNDVKSSFFESTEQKFYYAAAKVVISDDYLKGFVDSLNDSRYVSTDLQYALTNNFVGWWELDIGKVSGYYESDDYVNSKVGWVAYELFISEPIGGLVTLYLSKYPSC